MPKNQITCKAVVQGKPTSATISLMGGADDVNALGALLAGGYETKQVDESLSDMTNADTNVANTNPVSAIYMYGPQNQMASIKPFGGGSIHFKESVSVQDIANVCKNLTPFELLPNAKPTNVVVKRVENFSGE